MTRSSRNFDVIIAGGGPAGTSAAIHLANCGASVLLAERKKFPRAKLCGEFISPECLDHFERLGVTERMTRSGGAELRKTVFYARTGRYVTVPSAWFGTGASALGLSRAEMDHNLLNRAKECGVTVLEDAHVSTVITIDGSVRGVSLKIEDEQQEYFAPITIDATGRSRAITRRLQAGNRSKRSSLVAFKAHLSNTHVEPDACEIYSYPGGYGGLNRVEDELCNFCFIVSARDARQCDSDPEKLIRVIVSKNARAAETLKNAHVETPWLGVALESFGRQKLVPAKGLLTVGDAASFIDPFTGSGMLMALESGEIAANAISGYLQDLNSSFTALANDYLRNYARQFSSRLRICSWLRRAAFAPKMAEAVILLFRNDWLRERLTRATRENGLEFRQST